MDIAVQFVDDKSQFVNALGTSQQSESAVSHDDIMQSAKGNAQRWANYLWMLGGN
jgi:hypothetical protein